MSFQFLNKLPSPEQVKTEYPLPAELAELKKRRDTEISNVLKGIDSRFLVIIGPCSADNEDSVLDYLTRLSKVAEKVVPTMAVIYVFLGLSVLIMKILSATM